MGVERRGPALIARNDGCTALCGEIAVPELSGYQMKTLNLPHRSEGFELKVVVTDAEARGIVAGPANFDKTSSIQCQY